MTFDEFNASIRLLPKDEAHRLRAQYITKFVETGTQLSREYLGPLEGRPGALYWGYLWDFLRGGVPVCCELLEALVGELGEVLVMWDLHPDNRVEIEDYWRFEKDDVLSLDYATLMGNLQYLPEDIYIFDQSFQWTLVRTHEHVDHSGLCLRSGDIPRGRTARCSPDDRSGSAAHQ